MPNNTEHREPAVAPLAYSPKKVAELLQISEQMVRKLISSRELPSFRVGSLLRVQARDLEAFINARTLL
jgi:excisionase family DNA binding protein